MAKVFAGRVSTFIRYMSSFKAATVLFRPEKHRPKLFFCAYKWVLNVIQEILFIVKKVLFYVILCFSSIFIASTSAVATTSVADSIARLSSIYNQALKNDATLARVTFGTKAQQQQIYQARSVFLPAVNLSGNIQTSDIESDNDFFSGSSSRGWRVTLTQPIVDISSVYSYKSIKSLTKMSMVDLSQAKNNLILRTLQSYLNVLRAYDQLQSAKAQENAVERQLRQVQQRFDIGIVDITDVLDAVAALDNAVVFRIQTEGDMVIFFEDLYQIVGRNFTRIGLLKHDFPVSKPKNNAESWVKTGIEHNLTLKAVRHSLESAQYNLRAKRSAHLPTINLSASYQYDSSVSYSTSGVATKSAVLSLQLPVFQGGLTHYQAKEIKHKINEARWFLEETQRQVTRNIRAFYQNLITDVYRVKARRKSIDSNKSVLTATRTGYEAGTRTILDVLQAERNLIRSQFDYTSSRYDYLVNMFRLKNEAGVLNREDLQQYDKYINLDKFVQNSVPAES